jgi:hypothetical protein
MIYRKRGYVVRWENGTLIRVTESGVAVEDGDSFECRPDERAVPFEPRTDHLKDVLAALGDLAYERLIVARGFSEHECDGREWSEESARIHASIIRADTRVLVDTTIDRANEVRAVAAALDRIEGCRDAPSRLRVAPNVTAALLPSLVALRVPGARLVQTAGGVDGYGNPIVEAEEEWPNFYRPSYRVRPVRMPLNLRIECDETAIDETAPRAIALLAPMEGPSLSVLVEDRGSVYAATVRVTRIRAVAHERTWYPYAGGSFGAEMML